ncbi:MAG: hypothetical protein M5U18_08355 [Dehalococcoidia bacterium]|nr:hypothetical protein [Dehalococcoidia bacterium]
MTEQLYSAAEVAAAARLSRVRVNAIALKHDLGARVGGHRVFTQADVEVIRDRRSWWGKNPEVPPVPTLYSAADVAARLQLSIGTIDALGRSGVGQKVGSFYVFTPEDVAHLEARRRTQRPSTTEIGQTFYSLSAAAAHLAVKREVVQGLAAKFDLGRRKGQVNGRLLSAGEVERLRDALESGEPGV